MKCIALCINLIILYNICRSVSPNVFLFLIVIYTWVINHTPIRHLTTKSGRSRTVDKIFIISLILFHHYFKLHCSRLNWKCMFFILTIICSHSMFIYILRIIQSSWFICSNVANVVPTRWSVGNTFGCSDSCTWWVVS